MSSSYVETHTKEGMCKREACLIAERTTPLFRVQAANLQCRSVENPRILSASARDCAILRSSELCESEAGKPPAGNLARPRDVCILPSGDEGNSVTCLPRNSSTRLPAAIRSVDSIAAQFGKAGLIISKSVCSLSGTACTRRIRRLRSLSEAESCCQLPNANPLWSKKY